MLGIQVSMTQMTVRLMAAPSMNIGTRPTCLITNPNPTEASASQTPNTISTRPTT